MNLSAQHIATICNGKLVRQHTDALSLKYLSTDSRTIRNPRESIFVALPTEMRDGHAYIFSAYAQGVRCFLVSNEKKISADFNADVILVENSLRAMQQIAAHHRAQFKIPLVGITGSNGKTIVKEWLSQLLAHKECVAKNPKSYNSQLGVALSVAQLTNAHSIGVFEAGISEVADMPQLEKMLSPELGIFTMIGAAHDANFTSQEEKIREKLLLFVRSKKLFYCKDHPAIDQEVHSFLVPQNKELEMITWGQTEEADLHVKSIEKKNGTHILAVYKKQEVQLQLPYTDDAHIENAMHCWLFLLAADYVPQDISPWFRSLQPIEMRLEIIKGIGNCTLINDTYSSDFASLRIALDFLKEQHQHKKHSLILSDIDQHNEGDKIAQSVASLLKNQKLHRLILLGNTLSAKLEVFEALGIGEVLCFSSVSSFLDATDGIPFQDEAILVKGARRFSLERIVQRLEKNIHRTVMHINLSNLVDNVHTFKKHLKPTTKLMAMVKAFSYGSGSYEIAQTLEQHGIDYLAVAYVDEGIALRQNGIQLPILVLNPDPASLDAMLHYNLEPELYSIGLLKQFVAKLPPSNERLPVHLKLDTGMHRLGIEEHEVEQFINELIQADCFEVKSIFSHLVASDDPVHAEFTLHQKETFTRLAQQIENRLGYQCIKHLSNSGGVQNQRDFEFDMVRLGIGLYGISDKNEWGLKQVSTLSTQVSQIKNLDVKETVGYGRAGVLERDSKIATLNIGYADGFSRSFSKGVGKVLIHGKLAPVVGSVCMDMIMVDVTDIPNVQASDTAIIFGDELPVTKLAAWIDTIPYEIISGISQRVKRVFYRE